MSSDTHTTPRIIASNTQTARNRSRNPRPLSNARLFHLHTHTHAHEGQLQLSCARGKAGIELTSCSPPRPRRSNFPLPSRPFAPFGPKDGLLL